MSCPHGIWHEEDCQQCTRENELLGQIAEHEAAYELLFKENAKLRKELESRATTEKQNAEFKDVTRPVIEWLNANFHPHVTVVIDPISAVLSEGTLAYTTHEYVRD